jgi:O-antigen/teichoic acid export membrane protein
MLLVAVNLLVKPFYLLGIEAEIQNRTGQEVFGSYFALINFSFLLNILPDMGITNWNTRHIAAHPERVSTHFPALLSLRSVLGMIYLITLCLAGYFLGYTSGQLAVLALLGFNQVLATLVLFLRSNLAALHLFRHDSLLSVLDRAILVAMMAGLLWGTNRPFRIEWLVIGQTLSYGIACLTGLFLVIRKTGRLRLSFNPAFGISALRESFPYAMLFFISAMVFRVDSVMLERTCGAEEAGHYAMGFRFYEAVTMIAYLFAVLLLPMFSRMHQRNEDLSPLLGQAFRIMCAGVWVITSAAWVWNEEILLLIYDNPLSRRF